MPKAQWDQEVLTLGEAATFLRVTQDAVLALANNDAIPAQKIGGEWRFLKGALADWLRYGRQLDREIRRYPLPWLHEPMLEEFMRVLERRLLSRIEATEEKGARPGSKEAVLKHFGVFREDDDLESRLSDARAQREADR